MRPRSARQQPAIGCVGAEGAQLFGAGDANLRKRPFDGGPEVADAADRGPIMDAARQAQIAAQSENR